MSALLANKPLLGPLVGLNLWTFGIEFLLYKRRIPALAQYNVTFDPETVKKQKEEKLPGFVKWPADNFNNLLEQPTQFYAVLLGLSLLDTKDKRLVGTAWHYSRLDQQPFDTLPGLVGELIRALWNNSPGCLDAALLNNAIKLQNSLPSPKMTIAHNT
ncbi:hypothetical protein N0V91_011086 [Didymella pomorum]|uniref:Uncharacterized protein n=1 Tax=Didymella pomorum TaxID=749634 RepID=A0A9W9D0W4_9PLEO|nr:hypothetical protein N0V91_011086 [Didymella pomorum]